MSIGSTDTVKNTTPPPSNPGTASPKQVKEFNEAVDRSTTSNSSRSQQSRRRVNVGPHHACDAGRRPRPKPSANLRVADRAAESPRLCRPGIARCGVRQEGTRQGRERTGSAEDAGSPADGRLQAAQVRCGRKVRRRDGQGAEEIPDRPLPEGYRTSRQADHGAAQHRVHQVPRIRQTVCRREAQHHHCSRLR